MAKLRRRNDRGGKYFLDYYDIDGKRHRVDTGTTDPKVAALWKAEAERQIALARIGQRSKVGRITLDEVIGNGPPVVKRSVTAYRSEYLDRCEHDLEFSASTLELIGNAFDSFVASIGDKALGDVTDEDVRQWKRDAGKRVVRTTISIYQRTLRAAWNRAIKWEMLSRSPFANVELPKTTNKREDMPYDHVRQLLDKIEDPKFALYIRFLLYTGCRRNEILNLKYPDDIDTRNWILLVRAQKTGKDYLAPINKALRSIIDSADLKEGYVFESEKCPGRPWNESTVTHKFKKEIRRLGLPDHYTLHSLRHTYATRLRERGVPMDIVGVLLGHSSPATTFEYDHSRALHFRHFADLLDFEEVGANRAPEGNGGDKKSS